MATSFEIIREAGKIMRPERSIGSGLKTPINAGIAVRVGDTYFATVEPADEKHAAQMNRDVAIVAEALRAAGHTQMRLGGPLV